MSSDIEYIDYKIAEKFPGTDGDIYCSGMVINLSLQWSNKNKYWHKYDNDEKYKLMAHFKSLAKK
eukprot:13562143-Ditylum_brightwellii.AAC.1